MKLEGFKGYQLAEQNFPEKKNYFGGEKIFLQSRDFWILPEIKSIDVSFFTLKAVDNHVLYNSAKASCLGKIW